MNPNQTKRTSKFLSLVLRHQPETIGIELDSAGWVKVDELLAAINRHPNQIKLDRKSLEQVVGSNDKQRFEFDEKGTSIRARQGHSIDVALGYQPTTPPELLLHGTPRKFVAAICDTGIKKMKRHHVHLHTDLKTATDVGARRGDSVILTVRAGDMHRAGFEFFVTENGVWLTDFVPAEFIEDRSEG
ncbi:RNA 2'-phosphotransferase [Mariniblastus sp.]|nr:RNA 2'-phosphotransferase [Mariniblastus sp.]